MATLIAAAFLWIMQVLPAAVIGLVAVEVLVFPSLYAPMLHAELGWAPITIAAVMGTWSAATAFAARLAVRLAGPAVFLPFALLGAGAAAGGMVAVQASTAPWQFLACFFASGLGYGILAGAAWSRLRVLLGWGGAVPLLSAAAAGIALAAGVPFFGRDVLVARGWRAASVLGGLATGAGGIALLSLGHAFERRIGSAPLAPDTTSEDAQRQQYRVWRSGALSGWGRVSCRAFWLAVAFAGSVVVPLALRHGLSQEEVLGRLAWPGVAMVATAWLWLFLGASRTGRLRRLAPPVALAIGLVGLAVTSSGAAVLPWTIAIAVPVTVGALWVPVPLDERDGPFLAGGGVALAVFGWQTGWRLDALAYALAGVLIAAVLLDLAFVRTRDS